jgi:acyl-CoA thioesterase
VAEQGAGAERGQRPDQAGAFDRDTAVRRLEDEHSDGALPLRASFLAEIVPEWCINGRPHGGYLAAILMRALIEAVHERERAPRSLTIHFLRPSQPGALRIETITERAGGSLSTLSARIVQEGETVALALAAFSLSRASLEIADLPMPEVAAADPSRQFDAELGKRIDEGLAPAFLRNLVLQVRGGARPFTGSDAPLHTSAWVGLPDASRPLDEIALALFSDALLPTPFVRLREPGGAPTVDLTIHFREPLAQRSGTGPAALCLAQFDSRLIHHGFFEEDGVIWAADGTVLAQSRQLALLIAAPAR